MKSRTAYPLILSVLLAATCAQSAQAERIRADILRELASDPEPVPADTKGFPVRELRLRLECREFKKASEILDRASPGAPPYYVNLWKGVERYKHSDPDEACEYFRKCLPLHDVSAWVRCAVGHSFCQIGEYKQALQILGTVPKDKYSVDFYGARADCYIPLHRADEAVADLLAESKLKGDARARIVCNAAQVYYGEGRYKEALDLVNKSMQDKREAANYAIFRGFCYIKLNQDARAVEDFTAAINEVKSEPTGGQRDNSMMLCRAYGERAKCYERLGKTGLAQRDRVSLAAFSKNLNDDLVGKSGDAFLKVH